MALASESADETQVGDLSKMEARYRRNGNVEQNC